jgi:hypothetical protein
VQLDDDLYAHLGVAPSATVDEIAAAFRARAKELHPDRHPGDAATAERFKVLTHAYGVLTDPARRSAYDRRRTTPAPTPAATARGTTHQPVFGTTRSARIGLWSGVALLALGIASGVVLSAVDTGDAPKAITLWLITAKLVICGAILWAVAAWRLHRLKARAVPTQR